MSAPKKFVVRFLSVYGDRLNRWAVMELVGRDAVPVQFCEGRDAAVGAAKGWNGRWGGAS